MTASVDPDYMMLFELSLGRFVYYLYLYYWCIFFNISSRLLYLMFFLERHCLWSVIDLLFYNQRFQ